MGSGHAQAPEHCTPPEHCPPPYPIPSVRLPGLWDNSPARSTVDRSLPHPIRQSSKRSSHGHRSSKTGLLGGEGAMRVLMAAGNQFLVWRFSTGNETFFSWNISLLFRIRVFLRFGMHWRGRTWLSFRPLHPPLPSSLSCYLAFVPAV